MADLRRNRYGDTHLCPIILPLAMEFMSGLMYGLIACKLSHDGSDVDPGDITLLNCFESRSFSCLITMPLLVFIGFSDLQLACVSMTTSSISDPVDFIVFIMAHMYWSISRPSVNAGLL